MTDRMYDELAIERDINEKFGVKLDISHMIVHHVPVSRSSYATLILTAKKQLFLHISGNEKLLLGDIKKLVSRMGLKADTYIPPKKRPTYFNDIARAKFREVFPGRKHINDDDLLFYRTLVPYNPALILINEVKDGKIYQFDCDSTNNWRVSSKFAYRRIKKS